MSAETHRPDTDKLIRTVRAVHALDVRNAPTQHSQRTSLCPSLGRFGDAFPDRWVPEEEQHVRNCPYCQKVLAMFARADEAEKRPPVSDEQPADRITPVQA